MKQTKIMMGMTINVEIVDLQVKTSDLDRVFEYFNYVDEKFSPFRPTSELMRINKGELLKSEYSPDMQEILKLAEQTKQETDGFFDIINRRGALNPAGIVKGWAIFQAAQILWRSGLNNFFIDAGGDIQTSGKNEEGKFWTVGIRSPFNPETEIVKVLELKNNEGIATSGTYVRGQHVYNPKNKNASLTEIVSLTVVGPNIYEADRFATAVFAMGRDGITFLENLPNLEGYAIDSQGVATITSNFAQYVKNN